MTNPKPPRTPLKGNDVEADPRWGRAKFPFGKKAAGSRTDQSSLSGAHSYLRVPMPCPCPQTHLDKDQGPPAPDSQVHL